MRLRAQLSRFVTRVHRLDAAELAHEFRQLTHLHSVMGDVDRTDVQGNVLRVTRHPHVAYIFLRISDKEQAREALGCLVSDIAHDGDWVQPPPSRINVAFTHSGLVAMGVTPDTFARFPEFADGMRARAGLHLLDVGANAPEHWQPGLRMRYTFLLTIYGATAEERAAELARVEGCLASGGTSPVLTQLIAFREAGSTSASTRLLPAGVRRKPDATARAGGTTAAGAAPARELAAHPVLANSSSGTSTKTG